MSALRRGAVLLGWLVLFLVPGGLAWRYRRGGWLAAFNHDAAPARPVLTVADFEQTRAVLSRRHLAYAFEYPADAVAARALWSHALTANLLYSTTGRRELQALRFLRLMRHLPWRGRVLEFACGAAPLACGLEQAWPFPAPRLTLADIDWPVHQAVRRRFLTPDGGSRWPVERVLDVDDLAREVAVRGGWDAIVATECLEHVPDPPMVARQLVDWLRPGGRLLYDYAPQTMDQPYAPRGRSAREPTLALLAQRLRVTGPDARGLHVGIKP